MMVNLAELLPDARRRQYAIGSFNVYNYETIRGVIEANNQLEYPAIVAFAENYLVNMELDEVAALVRTMAGKSKVPLVLHLDHCKHVDNIARAIKAGFTSVMYDGSSLSYQDNVRQTAQVVAMAHAANVSVEAELGALAGGAYSNEESGEEVYTNPAEAADFVERTGVDALAVSIGTVHGMYKGTPCIDLDILKQIAARVDIPLVLHGGSGTPVEVIQACIQSGIAKINVNTEISVLTVNALKELLNTGRQHHFSQLSVTATAVVKAVVTKYATMFRPG